MWKVVIALLSVGICVASAASVADLDYEDGCYPVWGGLPRPDCSKAGTETMHNWEGMNYLYVARKLSKSEAEDYCDPFDEAVCSGEYPNGKNGGRWQTTLVSTPAKNEMKDAVIPAFNKACVKAKYDGKFLFWSGAVKIESGKLAFSDGSSTSDFSFDSSIKEGSDCVAFDNEGGVHVIACSTKLPFMCKIQPVSH